MTPKMYLNRINKANWQADNLVALISGTQELTTEVVLNRVAAGYEQPCNGVPVFINKQPNTGYSYSAVVSLTDFTLIGEIDFSVRNDDNALGILFELKGTYGLEESHIRITTTYASGFGNGFKFSIDSYNSGGSVNTVDEPNDRPYGRYKIALTKVGTGLSLYIDGKLVAMLTDADAASYTTTEIGAEAKISGPITSGDVTVAYYPTRVYSVVLTEEQIQATNNDVLVENNTDTLPYNGSWIESASTDLEFEGDVAQTLVAISEVQSTLGLAESVAPQAVAVENINNEIVFHEGFHGLIADLPTWSATTAYSAGDAIRGTISSPPEYAWKCEIALDDSTLYPDGAVGEHVRIIRTAKLPSAMLDADGSNPALPDGGDIYITLDGTEATRVPCYLAYFTTNNDPSSAEAEIWLKLPDSSSESIYVHWRTGQTEQPSVSSTYGRNATFSQFRSFWRACLNPSGGGVKMINWAGDTSYDGSISGSNSWVLTTGQIGRCWYMDQPFGDNIRPITTSTPITNGMTDDRTILIFMTTAISSTGSEARMFLESGTNGTLVQVQRGPADYQRTFTSYFAGVYLDIEYSGIVGSVPSLFSVTLNSSTVNMWINAILVQTGTATNTTSSATTNAYMGERFRAPTVFSLMAVANLGFDQATMSAFNVMLQNPDSGLTTGTPEEYELTPITFESGFIALKSGTSGADEPEWQYGVTADEDILWGPCLEGKDLRSLLIASNEVENTLGLAQTIANTAVAINSVENTIDFDQEIVQRLVANNSVQTTVALAVSDESTAIANNSAQGTVLLTATTAADVIVRVQNTLGIGQHVSATTGEFVDENVQTTVNFNSTATPSVIHHMQVFNTLSFEAKVQRVISEIAASEVLFNATTSEQLTSLVISILGLSSEVSSQVETLINTISTVSFSSTVASSVVVSSNAQNTFIVKHKVTATIHRKPKGWTRYKLISAVTGS